MPTPARGLTQPQRVELSNRRLITAAAELITEKGWEATSAAEIGRRAGYSRAMVHARYGSKDAILEAILAHAQAQNIMPAAEPDSTGLQNAVAHFGRIRRLYDEDRDFLRATFVMTFEAVKTTSPIRGRLDDWFRRGVDEVAAGLRNGIIDGSVRPDIDMDRAVNAISAAAFGAAFQWIVLADDYDLPRELDYLESRIVAEYGTGD
ncbi:TetR/AcrR family transcriptional regulator [Mycobacterium manitobense]|uniref:TetR/AcrR family transcriptional regulator n=1 Tax=[Mycobacterium] manitobense TaxID=190147 RepID=A0A9X2YKK5_9MYCO|nr:TetR/AcrR family transcriptional regulator [[Mycobacterium] manitobense]MCV7169865.1 TetR/AcrR family transcriptional regulator [[Mycobacterium] manitobense]